MYIYKNSIFLVASGPKINKIKSNNNFQKLKNLIKLYKLEKKYKQFFLKIITKYEQNLELGAFSSNVFYTSWLKNEKRHENC